MSFICQNGRAGLRPLLPTALSKQTQSRLPPQHEMGHVTHEVSMKLGQQHDNELNDLVVAMAFALFFLALLSWPMSFSDPLGVRYFNGIDKSLVTSLELEPDRIKIKFFEKYLLTGWIVIGPILAAVWFGYFRRQSRLGISLACIAIAIPLLHLGYQPLRQHIAWLPLLLATIVLAVGVLHPHFLPTTQSYRAPQLLADENWTLWTTRRLLFLVVFAAILTVLMFPHSITSMAARIGPEQHIVSYMIGPALYRFIPSLSLGADYTSHYSLLTGPLFFHLLTPSLLHTLENYVWTICTVTTLFYISAFLLISWLFQSVFWGAAVTVTAFFLNFQTEGNSLFGPSAWPIRFPLLMIAVGLFIRLYRKPNALSACLLGVVMGASLCIMFETGIAITVSGAISFFIVFARTPGRFRLAGIVTVSALIAFYGISAAAYGKNAFGFAFHADLFEPILLYGKAMWGLEFINWGLNWGLISNLLVPGLAVATIAVLSRSFILGTERPSPDRAAILFLAIIGCFLTFKWVNRSLLAVWHQNSLPHLIVAAWWLRQFIERYVVPHWGSAGRRAACSAAFALTAIYVCFVFDPKQPTIPHGMQSYLRYPSIALNMVDPFPLTQWKGDEYYAPQQDLDLIKKHVGPDERAALISRIDWVFLLEAERAPKYYFVPSISVFDLHHLDMSLANADKLFIDRRSTLGYAWAEAKIKDVLSKQYRLAESGKDLDLYLKK
ncbi:hypothetical protein [Bradyrhizobium genomosp. I (2014)]|uniref:hypothetical protein n=1 Tax=Bradyrhizobium genomosp. I (2014) TaxID=2683269 RepID=UPI0012FA44A2|nr:hypothetical protein [Bradyrhizobium sp. CCBAU 43298]